MADKKEKKEALADRIVVFQAYLKGHIEIVSKPEDQAITGTRPYLRSISFSLGTSGGPG